MIQNAFRRLDDYVRHSRFTNEISTPISVFRFAPGLLSPQASSRLRRIAEVTFPGSVSSCVCQHGFDRSHERIETPAARENGAITDVAFQRERGTLRDLQGMEIGGRRANTPLD